jgi:hypothetical protein
MLREVIDRESPLDAGKTLMCNLQQSGGVSIGASHLARNRRLKRVCPITRSTVFLLSRAAGIRES